MTERITYSDVKASFNRNTRDPATMMYFGRPIADVITAGFFNRGWTANGVTYLCMVLSTIAMALLLAANPYLYAVSAALYYCVFVLDCVDGNLARLRNAASYYGKFMDGLSDGIFAFLAPIAVGLGLYWFDPVGPWLLLGTLATVCSLIAQMVRARYSFFREWAVREGGALTEDEKTRTSAPLRLDRYGSVLVVNGNFVAPLILAVPYFGPRAYLIWSAVFHSAAGILFVTAAVWQGSIVLRRHRNSVRAASNV